VGGKRAINGLVTWLIQGAILADWACKSNLCCAKNQVGDRQVEGTNLLFVLA
jgi:hypothetical protein